MTGGVWATTAAERSSAFGWTDQEYCHAMPVGLSPQRASPPSRLPCCQGGHPGSLQRCKHTGDMATLSHLKANGLSSTLQTLSSTPAHNKDRHRPHLIPTAGWSSRWMHFFKLKHIITCAHCKNQNHDVDAPQHKQCACKLAGSPGVTKQGAGASH